MKTYKALIVEDRPEQAAFLKSRLNELLPEIELCGICDTVAGAKTEISAQQPRLLFLDIDLGEQNGFDLLRNIAPVTFKVIFVTGKDDKDLVMQAIKVSAVDYLLKPYSNADLITAVKKATQALDKETLSELSEKLKMVLENMPSSPNKPVRVPIKNDDGERRVPTSDILFISTTVIKTGNNNNGTRVLFRLTNGDAVIISPKPDTSLEHYSKVLAPYNFVRISRNFIVNLAYIKSRKSADIIVQGYYDSAKKETICQLAGISELYRAAFDQAYDNYTSNLL